MLDRAFSLSPSVDTLLQQTAWLAGTGHFKEARTYLLRAKELSAFETPIKQRLHQAEIAARESRLASMTPSRR
jgi:hypothetical protein